MTQGVRVWDSGSNLILDTTDVVGRVLGLIFINTDGNLTDSQFSTGTSFYVFQTNNYSSFIQPLVTFSGTNMSWAIQNSQPYSGYLLYGVY